MSEWKSGDLAMVQCSDTKWRPAMYQEMRHGTGRWMFGDNSFRLESASAARPLFVVDPKDHYRVEVLCEALIGGVIEYDVEAVAEVLTALSQRRPAEPTNWLAAVIDRNGERWFRNGSVHCPWVREDNARCEKYADIDVVRVLSEGVTDE